MQNIRRRLTYANVISTLALIVALGGGTTAIAISGKVGGQDLAKIKVRQAFSPPDVGVVDLKASCKRGERLLGGGARLSKGSGDLTISAPDGNSWVVGANAVPLTDSGVAYALCLSK